MLEIGDVAEFNFKIMTLGCDFIFTIFIISLFSDFVFGPYRHQRVVVTGARAGHLSSLSLQLSKYVAVGGGAIFVSILARHPHAYASRTPSLKGTGD
jgi:hypothetical protein